MAKMPLSQRMSILQSRKDNKSIWYTTQRPIAVHKTLRTMTNYFYKCESVKFPFLRMFRKRMYDLETEDKLNEDKSLETKIYFAKKSIYQMYNTLEKIKKN